MTFIRENLPDPVSYFEGRGQKIIGKRGKRFRTNCAIHGGDGDTLSVLREDGGFNCFSCGAKGGDIVNYQMQATGEDFVTACKSLGAWVDDGKPHTPQRPKPIPRSAAMAVIEFESLLIRIEDAHFVRYIVPTRETHDRLLVAAQRIEQISEAFQ